MQKKQTEIASREEQLLKQEQDLKQKEEQLNDQEKEIEEMERAIQEMLHSGVAASTVAGTDYLSNNDDGVNIGSNEDADE